MPITARQIKEILSQEDARVAVRVLDGVLEYKTRMSQEDRDELKKMRVTALFELAHFRQQGSPLDNPPNMSNVFGGGAAQGRGQGQGQGLHY